MTASTPHGEIVAKAGDGKALVAPAEGAIPATLGQAGAGSFWVAVLLTGVATGLGAVALAWLLDSRSIYDAKLTNEQIAERQKLRDAIPGEMWPKQDG